MIRTLSSTGDQITRWIYGVTVKSIQRIYEARGMLQQVSSYGSGTTPLNQILLEFNSFSQLEQDYQEHYGAVNIATNAARNAAAQCHNNSSSQPYLPFSPLIKFYTSPPGMVPGVPIVTP